MLHVDQVKVDIEVPKEVEIQPGFKWSPFSDLRCDFPGCKKIAYQKCNFRSKNCGCSTFTGCGQFFCIEHSNSFTVRYASEKVLFYSCQNEKCVKNLNVSGGEYWKSRLFVFITLILLVLMIVGLTAETHEEIVAKKQAKYLEFSQKFETKYYSNF